MMLTFLNNKRTRFVLLLPVVFLVMNAFYFRYATKEIRVTMLDEKIVEIMVTIDTLAAAVEANPEIYWLEYEDILRNSVEFIDRLYQVYAGLYKFEDGYLSLVSERFFETSSIEPLDYRDFYEAVYTQENGKHIIRYTPDRQMPRELHLYYRWMPLYSPEHERFLVIGGVSSYSVTKNVSLWVSVGQWVSMIITFALNIWLVLLITRLGNVYESRTGDKWREEPDSDD